MALGFASPAGLVEESKESNGEKGNAEVGRGWARGYRGGGARVLVV